MLVVPFAFIADYFSDWFAGAYDIYFLVLLLCVLFYVLTPYKYFPLFTTLCIDETHIKKRLFGDFVTRKIERENVCIHYLILHGTLYVAFSKVDIPADKKEILRAVFLRQAMVFPWTSAMESDFPELFVRDQ